MAIFVGLIFIALGLWGLSHWLPDFLVVIKGLGPLVLLTSGVLAVVVGLASLGARRSGKS